MGGPRAGLRILLAALCLLLGSGRGRAHDLEPARATVVLTPARAELLLAASWHALTRDDTEEADRALAGLLRLRGDERAAWLRRIVAHFHTRIALTCDGAGVPLRLHLPGLEADGAEDVPREALPRLEVEAVADFPSPPRACAVRFGEDLGPVGLRLLRPGAHPEETRLLTPGETSPPYPLSSAPPAPPPGLWPYLVSGFEHIVPLGLDHVLFVLALFFAGAGWRPLLWQVSAFTLAHSVTLALGVLGVARLPATVVEPAIAASITLVALADLYTPPRARRLALVFVFGLLHGLGFAGALREAGLAGGGLATTLLGFNLGVEAGQLAVLAAASLLVWPLRRLAGYDRWIRRPACFALAGVGLVWTVQRLAA